MKFRLIPAAITPIFISDLLTAIKHQKGATIQFRQKITNYFDGNQTYTFTSLMRATCACLSTIKSITPQRNEVILPRYSCPSFVHGIIAAGMKVKYCDIDPKTLNIKLSSLKQVLSPKTSALIVANLFGLSNPINEIVDICHQKEIYVLEGVDYAFGSIYQNKNVGTFGDFTILNFQEGKALPIGGAAIIERNTTFMKNFDDSSRQRHGLIPFITLCGYTFFSKPSFYYWLIHILTFLKINRKQLSMEDTIRNTNSEFDFKHPVGIFPAISDFQASLGIILLNKMSKNIDIRLKNAMTLEKIVLKNPNINIINRDNKLSKTHYIRYPILVSCNPEKLCLQLSKVGIEASRMYLEHGMKIDKSKYPGAYQVAQSLVTIPCHPFMTNDDISDINNVIKLCI